MLITRTGLEHGAPCHVNTQPYTSSFAYFSNTFPPVIHDMYEPFVAFAIECHANFA